MMKLGAGTVAAVLACLAAVHLYAAGGSPHATLQTSPGLLLTGVSSPATLAAGLERMPDHLNQVVGLSAQQKAQTIERVEQARAELTALEPAYQQRNAQMLALMLQDKADNDAVERLRREQYAASENSSRKVTQTMLDLSRLLTPGQRQLFNDMAAKHHQGSH
ncbi:Spy/CpxP family protein refolding chaperone [Chitinimonas sp.]|uniref:Spy/CpxP family protein refolding chaperone n=1 Tax=Chitinimonas sp. TaxID=1934313 RepID=UPI002F93A8AE